eukprot:gene11801-biopygen10280
MLMKTVEMQSKQHSRQAGGRVRGGGRRRRGLESVDLGVGRGGRRAAEGHAPPLVPQARPGARAPAHAEHGRAPDVPRLPDPRLPEPRRVRGRKALVDHTADRHSLTIRLSLHRSGAAITGVAIARRIVNADLGTPNPQRHYERNEDNKIPAFCLLGSSTDDMVLPEYHVSAGTTETSLRGGTSVYKKMSHPTGVLLALDPGPAQGAPQGAWVLVRRTLAIPYRQWKNLVGRMQPALLAGSTTKPCPLDAASLLIGDPGGDEDTGDRPFAVREVAGREVGGRRGPVRAPRAREPGHPVELAGQEAEHALLLPAALRARRRGRRSRVRGVGGRRRGLDRPPGGYVASTAFLLFSSASVSHVAGEAEVGQFAVAAAMGAHWPCPPRRVAFIPGGEEEVGRGDGAE